MARSDKFNCDVDRFMAQCIPEPNSGCWLWTGSNSGDGEYASFWDKEVRKNTRASRWIYSKQVGPLKPRDVVMHSCDTPSCVNPAHLTAGSQSVNMKDASRKGRLMANKQTHCIHGHEFTPENTVISGINKPQRKCRICLKQRYEKRIKLRDCIANMKSVANDNDTLRTQLAEANEQRDYWESAAVEMRGYKESATFRAEKAEGRADGLYRALCASVVASGGVARDGLSDEFLILGVPAEMAARKKHQEATEAERDALAARVDELEGALRTFLKQIRVCVKNCEHNEQADGVCLGNMSERQFFELEFALARTPAQSLAACKATALREAAKEMQEVTDSIVWCEAELQGRQAIIDRVSEIAERLEAEDANG